MLSPKLIIFDLDGVLANTEHFYAFAMSKALQEQGFTKYTTEYYEQHFAGLAATLILEKVAKETGKEVDQEKLDSVIKELYLDFEKHIFITPGAEEFIKSLKIPFCVASSSDLSQIKRTLTALKLSKYFSHNSIFSCFSINQFKPNPAIYKEALKKMGFKAEEAIAIEDSLPGVQAASNADVAVIGFTGADYLKSRKEKHAELLLSNGAFAVKDNFAEIKKLITN